MSLLIITIATPSSARCAQQPIDFCFGADVDAARRFVDDQDLRRRARATSPARPSAGCRRSRWRLLTSIDGALTCNCRHTAPTRSRSFARRHEPVRRVAAQRRERHVFAHREVHHEAGGPAILGDEKHAVANRRPPGRRSSMPIRRGRIVPATRRSTPKIARATSDRPAPTRPAKPRISPRPTPNETAMLRIALVRSPSTAEIAHRGHGVAGEAGARQSMSRPTISRTMLSWVSSSRASAPAFAPSRSTTARSAIGLHFAEPVRDVDDGHAALAQIRDDLVQPGRLGQRQARRRLVHDEHARVERERFRDLDELLLRDRQRGDGVSGEMSRPSWSR